MLRLTLLRRQRLWNQTQLGQLCSPKPITQSRLSLLERGAKPTPAEVLALTKVLGSQRLFEQVPEGVAELETK